MRRVAVRHCEYRDSRAGHSHGVDELSETGPACGFGVGEARDGLANDHRRLLRAGIIWSAGQFADGLKGVRRSDELDARIEVAAFLAEQADEERADLGWKDTIDAAHAVVGPRP